MLMSYKALADKLRMALGVNEPDTLSGVLDFGRGGDSGTPTPGPEKRPGETEATLNGSGDSPKSLKLARNVMLLKSNVKEVIKRVHRMNEHLQGAGGFVTMASLEAALREQLGIVWMRRGRRGRSAA